MLRAEQRQGIIAGTGFSEKASDFENITTDYGDVRVGHLQLGGERYNIHYTTSKTSDSFAREL